MIRLPVAFACVALVALSAFVSRPAHAADAKHVATISYWRGGLHINGERRRGVQYVVPGDRIQAGDEPASATVSVKFPDSTSLNVNRHGEVTMWLSVAELHKGGVSANTVLGTKLLTDLYSPVGRAELIGVTFGMYQGDDGRYDINVSDGKFVLHLADDATLEIGKGARVHVTPSADGEVTGELYVVEGSVTLAGKTVAKRERQPIALAPAAVPDAQKHAATGAPDGEAQAAPAKPAMPEVPTSLPTDHAWQKTLRDHLATLTESDFAIAVEPFTVAMHDDPEERYRIWLLKQDVQPVIGTKRGAPSVTAPPKLFLLSSIETDDAVMQPPVWPAALAWLVSWDYEGNPYHDAKPLKLRAFVKNVVNMTMLDHQLEVAPERGGNRSDWYGPNLIEMAYGWNSIKDALPSDVQAAYETGLRKMAGRLLDWGPKGEEINTDAVGIIGLWEVSKALGDDAFTKRVEAYARLLFEDPGHFDPAGYFINQQGPDLAFGGMAGFAGIYVGLDSDWLFLRESIDKWYRLRSHMVLPEPDGTWEGPTHFNSRIGQTAHPGQWDWAIRDLAGAMLSDEAAWMHPLPTEEKIEASYAELTDYLTFAVGQISQGIGPDQAEKYVKASPWAFRMYPSYSFPIVTNLAYDHYKPGTYAKLKKLHDSESPMTHSPYQRGEVFVRNFGDAFIATQQPTYAAIVHSGNVGHDVPNTGLFHFEGPLGFGGGQLSAFWTRDTGSVILGRRGGMHWDRSFDTLEAWRIWPVHAVFGTKADGKVFTSARIVKPNAETTSTGGATVVTVSGMIPREAFGQGKTLEGTLDYERAFTLGKGAVHVQTSVTSSGQDTLDELIETIPVFLRNLSSQRKQTPTSIAFEVGGKFVDGDAAWHDNVTRVRLTRFDGAVDITFDKPQRVALSPEDWRDNFITRAACRNIVIDLMQGDAPRVLREASVGYSIAPVSAGQ